MITKDATLFIGIDPGYYGAIARMYRDGSLEEVIDMPLLRKEGKNRLDYTKVKHAVSVEPGSADPYFGLEMNTTRPGEPPEPAFRFGLQTGFLLGLIWGQEHPCGLISPVSWKKYFGLRGKEKDPKSEDGVAWMKEYKPDEIKWLYGPRGGLLDGRLDSILIAEYCRRMAPGYLKSVSATHGKDSAEFQAAVMNCGPRRRR